jgi:hypothetical protein
VRVEDEWGHPWHVSGGDPGNKPVNLLRRLGYTYVVLPYESLAWGHYAGSARQPSDMGIVQRIRMIDCMEELSEQV